MYFQLPTKQMWFILFQQRSVSCPTDSSCWMIPFFEGAGSYVNSEKFQIAATSRASLSLANASLEIGETRRCRGPNSSKDLEKNPWLINSLNYGLYQWSYDNPLAKIQQKFRPHHISQTQTSVAVEPSWVMSVSHDSVKVLGETRAKWPSQALILTIEMGARDKVVSFQFERDCLISPVRTIQNWHPVFNSWGSMEKEAKRCYKWPDMLCIKCCTSSAVVGWLNVEAAGWLLAPRWKTKVSERVRHRTSKSNLQQRIFWCYCWWNKSWKLWYFPYQLVQDLFPSNV